MVVAKSGIQKEVLALYRTLLREATKKDRMVAGKSSRRPASFTDLLFANDSSSTAHARDEFRKQASRLRRNDFRTIEHKIRHGYKQIKLLQMPGVVTFKSW
ncbi:unnamed protein product [Pseudo-nitzschia multistriata]|uniref:Complex 1 LYR protein n=1 Tax=Pseudo-nitzschia multistriata TaxID=183589 RepID=A0A448YVH0_9STRA|nr:unnamed protein product [Pseudo-nitzschia multistriata]